MAGERDLDKLLTHMQPRLLPNDFVFCTAADLRYGDLAELRPLASYQEVEGLSLVLEKQVADATGLAYDSVYSCIALMVHSSLDAVGLTAAVSSKLAMDGISANMIAAFYHDHLFVPREQSQRALQLLQSFQN